MNDTLSLLDLLDNPSPAGRAALLDALVDLAAGLKRRMDAGLPPEEMTVARPLYEAAQAARGIADKLLA